MQVLRDQDAISAFLASHIEDELFSLIAGRVEELSTYEDYEPGDLVNFILMGPADSIATLNQHLGFDALINRFNDTPFGSSSFSPSWEDMVSYQAWYEITYVLSDDGAGLVLLIPKDLTGGEELLSMCSTYARTPSTLDENVNL